MPIYEYYCPDCHSRFAHLARRYDEAPPPCPQCGAERPEKLVAAAHLGRSEAARRADFDQRARQAGGDGQQQAAHFLHEQAGGLLEEIAPVDPDAYRAILAARSRGASDADLKDISDRLAAPLSLEWGEHDKPGTEPDGEEVEKEHKHTHGKRMARHLGWSD